jgi:hypothetical protein
VAVLADGEEKRSLWMRLRLALQILAFGVLMLAWVLAQYIFDIVTILLNTFVIGRALTSATAGASGSGADGDAAGVAVVYRRVDEMFAFNLPVFMRWIVPATTALVASMRRTLGTISLANLMITFNVTCLGR